MDSRARDKAPCPHHHWWTTKIVSDWLYIFKILSTYRPWVCFLPRSTKRFLYKMLPKILLQFAISLPAHFLALEIVRKQGIQCNIVFLKEQFWIRMFMQHPRCEQLEEGIHNCCVVSIHEPGIFQGYVAGAVSLYHMQVSSLVWRCHFLACILPYDLCHASPSCTDLRYWHERLRARQLPALTVNHRLKGIISWFFKVILPSGRK